MKLKYLYITIISLLINLYSYSQETVVNIEDRYTIPPLATNTGVYYFKDTNNLLDKFVGSWVFNDGTHYLRLIITKHIHVTRDVGDFHTDDDFDDLIKIRIEYRLAGIEKYNTTEERALKGEDILNVNTIENIIYFEPSLTSCQREKLGYLKIEYLINISGDEQLIWTRTNTISEVWGNCPDGTPIDDSDFIIPANLVLTKE